MKHLLLTFVRIKGYPSVCSHWDRKQEAEDWAKGVESQIKAGQFKFDQHNKIHSFSELIERYKQDGVLEHHRSANDTLRHLAYWQSRFSDFSLVHLTPELLGKERQLLLNTPTPKGTKRTSSTMNRYMASLSSLLTYAAQRLNWMDDQPSIGIILCRTKDNVFAEYVLRNFNRPIGVAEFEVKLVEKLPKELKSSLPTVAEIEAELSAVPAAKKNPRKKKS